MKKDPVVIVGGVAAGTSAAAYLKRLKPSIDIILAEQSETVSYGTCEFPYVLSREIPDPERLVFYTPEKLAEEKGITVLVNHRLVSVNPTKKTATFSDTRFHSTKIISYSKLLLATGASPIELPELVGANSFSLKSYQSLVNSDHILKSGKRDQALIIGAGLIGLELADAMRKLNIQVTLIDKSEGILSGKVCVKDSGLIKTLADQNGVRFIGNARVSHTIRNQKNEIVEVHLSTGEILKTDIIFQSVGFKPNSSFSGLEKLKKAQNGAIIVNKNMETSISDIYAAGDCAVTGKSSGKTDIWFPLATAASKMGRSAAAAISKNPEPYKAGNNTWGIQIFGHDFVQSGLSFHQAEDLYGSDAKTITVETSDRVKIMPGSKPLFLRLNFLKRSGRLVGASQLGQAGTGIRINTLSLAISQKMTLTDLEKSDFLYTPALAPLWDPVLVAARLARKLK